MAKNHNTVCVKSKRPYVVALNHNCAMAKDNTRISDFWRRLAEAMGKDVEMKQKDVARRWGFKHNTTVSRWKLGDGLPDPDLLKRMCEELGYNLDWLVHNRGPKKPLPRLMDAEFAKLIEFWAELNPATRRLVLDYAVYQRARQGNAAKVITPKLPALTDSGAQSDSDDSEHEPTK